MTAKNILVFPCGSEIGLDIYYSVRYSTYFHLIGGSSVEDHGKFVYEDYIPNIPFASATDFLETIKLIVSKRNIDAIYPTMDSVISILKKHEAEIQCKVISSSAETSDICLSKSRTYQTMDGIIRIPKLYDKKYVSVFPCFAKPDIGYGARGTQLIKSKEELIAFTKGKDDILIMENLPGEEYTVDCFTNSENNLLYCAARIRNRIKSGISVNTSFVNDQQEFLEMAKRINSRIPFRGAWFFQVKRTEDGELCLLEIAARLGGSSLLSNARGVNLALLSLFDAFEYPVNISPNKYTVELDRALSCRYSINLDYSSVYIDYDDCLILNKKTVNTELVKFIYECINQNKKVYLLSKHDGNLADELKRFHMTDLFTHVYHLAKTDDKADFINEQNAIFIDDSHKERINIQRKCGIAVFGPEMVNILM